MALLTYSLLIVDDNAAFRALAGRLLRDRGFRIAGEAADAAGGLGAARALRPDVVLLDVNLPDRNGFALSRALAQLPAPPRVVLTSTDSDVSARTVRDCGAHGFVAKERLPAGDLVELLETLASDGYGRPVDALRVVIGEDQTLLREGVARLLMDSGFDVVAQAADAPELLRKVRAHRPDVVIVDVQMPPDRTDDGLRAALQIRKEEPGIGVLVLSQHLEVRYALDLVGESAEGVGYLLKDRVGDLASFTEALRRVAAGGSALDPEVVARMVGRRREHNPLDELTPREREVLGMMAQGKSNQGIAEALVVTTAAVEKHIGAILSKLAIGHEPTEHRRVMAILTLLRQA